MNVELGTRDYVPATVQQLGKESGGIMFDNVSLSFKKNNSADGTKLEDLAVGQEILVHFAADGRRLIIDSWKTVK